MRMAGLIVGLGNPGKEYDQTRHNMGFMAVDRFMDDARRFSSDACASVSGGKNGVKGKFLLWKCFLANARTSWLVAKPQTYMNLSGEAVRHICDFHSIAPDQILVVHDELDLPLGRIKFKSGGGLAGHNGLKSIAQHLGTRDFHRLRIGIGKPEHGDTVNYVLGRFSTAEQPVLKTVLDESVQGMVAFTEQGAEEAMRVINALSSIAR